MILSVVPSGAFGVYLERMSHPDLNKTMVGETMVGIPGESPESMSVLKAITRKGY